MKISCAPARIVFLVALLGCMTMSCKKPEPPPPPPAPPPPPPAPLTRDEMARRLGDTYSMMLNVAFTPADEVVGSRESLLGGGGTGSTPNPSPPFKRWIDRQTDWAKRIPPLAPPPPTSTAVTKKAWRDGLLATFVEESLKWAKDGDYHVANVLISDASRLMSRDDSENESLKRFFRDVATRQSAEACGQSINRFIQRYRRQAVLDATHASVLLRAKSDVAAHYTAQRVEAGIRLILLPLVARCRSYAESYAFRVPEIDDESLRYLERLVDTIGTHARGRPVDPELFAKAVRDDDSPAYRESLAAVRAAHRAAAEVDPEQAAESPAGDGKGKRTLTELVDLVSATRRSFRQWIQDRRDLFETFSFYAGSNLEAEGGFGTTLPQLYQREDFQGMAPLILDEMQASRLLKWVDGQGEQAPDGIPVEVAFATLGWYYMDTQRPGLAQRAFLEGAYAALTDQAGDTLGTLAAELNGYRLLLTATALTTAPAGALLPTAGTLDEVEILLAAWRSKWIRLGGMPQIADQQINEFLIQSSFKKRRLAEIARNAARDRYFFDDYIFPDGSMPSVVLDSLVETPLAQVHDADSFQYAGLLALDDYFRQCRLPTKVDPAFLELWTRER